jgi:putative IMPACT (imprinted ancient) family translation regulator
MPIYGQIQAFDLTDVLVAVVRYFGGTKLGVGGLITAYKNTAQLTLENADLRTIVPLRNLEISFGYPLMHRAMRIIKKQNIQISDQVNGQILKYRLMVPVSNYQKVVKQFRALKGIEVYEEDTKG